MPHTKHGLLRDPVLVVVGVKRAPGDTHAVEPVTVGHIGTTVTELVPRHQLRPVIQTFRALSNQIYDRR